jgi:hypothetical protein
MRDDVILEAAIYRVERRSQVFDVKPSFNYGALSAMVGQKYIFVAGNSAKKFASQRTEPIFVAFEGKA